MKGIHDLITVLLNAGITDPQLEILAHSEEPLKVVIEVMIEQIKIATKRFEAAGEVTKRPGRRPRPPRTVRGVDAPAPTPDQQATNALSVTPPTNPVIKTAPEAIELPPVTLHASCVEKELAKLNGADSVGIQSGDDKAPPTRVDLPRPRDRLNTPASPVESSTNDSEQADTSVPPPTVDPIAPVLGVMAGKTVEKITKKKRNRESITEATRKAVVAPK